MSLFSLRSCHSFFSSMALAVLISLPQRSVSSLPFTIHLLNELPRVESLTPKPHPHHLQAHTQHQSSVPRAEHLPQIRTTLTSSPSASVVLVYSHYTIHNSQYKHASTTRVNYHSSSFSTRLAAVKVGTSLTIRSGLAIALRLPSAEVEQYGVRCNRVVKLTAAKGLHKWGEERPMLVIPRYAVTTCETYHYYYILVVFVMMSKEEGSMYIAQEVGFMYQWY